MPIHPFRIAIPDETLADLRDRLKRTRFPQSLDVGWAYGMDPAALKNWCERWAKFDWRRAEARLNRFDQFRFAVDGIDLHFLHVKSKHADAVPLLMLNGWPSNFVEYSRIIDAMVDPPAGRPAFHVVIPSLPGFGFSSLPAEPGWNISRMAAAIADLMDEIGYDRYFIQGGDMGAGVMLGIATKHPHRVLGMHSINVYWGYPRPKDLSPAEKEWFQRGEGWQMAEGGYAIIQASKPQTVAPGLTDSPAGLAAWILEKWHGWSQNGLDGYDPDDLLAMLTVYWATGSIGASCRLYLEAMRDPFMKTLSVIKDVPSGVLLLPGDMMQAPRDWGERWLDVVRWTEAKKGGHFAALEAPDVLAEDVRATVEAIRASRRGVSSASHSAESTHVSH
jgi:pimeloyl-ACP methyl ester carboxylesterase